MMRRVFLLTVGLGAGSVLLSIFCSGAVKQYMTVQAAEEYIVFPYKVMGTDLVVSRLVRYEGIFLEDGLDEEIADVAALVVENTGGVYVAEGEIVLRCGEELLQFCFTSLPPDSVTLILERNKMEYQTETPIRCEGWTRCEYPENNGAVIAVPSMDGNMAVINRMDTVVPELTVYYKSFDKESGMYIGGITYSVQVSDLQSREIRRLLPYHFAVGYSKVVTVRVSNG